MNILEQITNAAAARVEQSKREHPEAELRASLTANPRPFLFERALAAPGMSFICEVKKASPSKGLIAPHFPYLEIAGEYEAAGASAISVLTEPEFFHGNLQYLREIREQASIPVLRKDFTIDPYQIYEAAAAGADAILLICAILPPEQLRSFRELADDLGLSCLVEAHDEAEVETALEAGARIVGVNNRDLKTFRVDTSVSVRLRGLVPPDILFVSESGIGSHKDIRLLEEHGVNAVLVGETLMRSPDRKAALAALRGNAS